MRRLIDADKLMEEIEDYRGDIFASEIVELIKRMPTIGEWIPASQPPNVFDEHGQSEDVIVKLEWFDDDITYSIGWYSGKYGWSDNERSVNVISWMPLPWMELSELY